MATVDSSWTSLSLVFEDLSQIHTTSPDKINRTINDFGIFDMGWIWALYGTLGIDVCWKMMPRGMGIDSTLGQDFRDFAFWDRFLRNQLFAISV